MDLLLLIAVIVISLIVGILLIFNNKSKHTSKYSKVDRKGSKRKSFKEFMTDQAEKRKDRIEKKR